MSDLITLEQLKSAVTPSLRPMIQQDLVDSFNKIQGEEGRIIRENLITYSDILTEGKFKLNDYFSAVKFVSQKMLGKSIIDSYIATFPDRYSKLIQAGKTLEDIYPYASVYNKTKLVVKICERTLIPPKILYQDVYHKAISNLVQLMMDSRSDKVRAMAAAELIKELSPKEAVGAQIQIDISQNNAVEELRKSFNDLAKQQMELMNQGASVKSIAEQGFKDV